MPTVATIISINKQSPGNNTPRSASAADSPSITTPIASVLETNDDGDNVPQAEEEMKIKDDGKDDSKEIGDSEDVKSKRRDKRLTAVRWAQSLDENQMELSTAVDPYGVPHCEILKLGGQDYKSILLDAKIAYARKIGIVVKQKDRSTERVQALLYARASGISLEQVPQISTKAHKGSKRKHEESLGDGDDGELEILKKTSARSASSTLQSASSTLQSASSSRNTTSAAAIDESECDDDNDDNDGPFLSHTVMHAITAQVERGLHELKLKFQYSHLRELQDVIFECKENVIETKAQVHTLLKKFEACKDNDHEDETDENSISSSSSYTQKREKLRTQIKKYVRKKKCHKAQLLAATAEYEQLKKRLQYKSDEGEDSDDELLSL
jgi:uncharacterized coiled-coil protein SlyX